MMRAKALAKRLGLAVKVTLMRAGHSLRLRFLDRSALVLSPTGCRLARDGRDRCNAFIFAEAHAKAVGWHSFHQQEDWLVPRPSFAGDWLSAPKTSFPEVRSQVLAIAEFNVLGSGSLDRVECARAIEPFTRQATTDPTLALASRKFLLLTPDCIAQSANALSDQIEELEKLATVDPNLRVVLFIRDVGFRDGFCIGDLCKYLHDSIALLQEEQNFGAFPSYSP